MALDELPSPSACARCPRTAPPLTRRRRVRRTRGVLSHARANARTALLVLLSFVHRRVDHSVQQPGGRRVDGAAGRDAQRAPRRAEKALSLARSPAPRPAHCTKPNRTEPMRCAALRCPPPPPPAKRRNNSLPVGFEPASSRSRSGIRTAMPIALVGHAPVCALFVSICCGCSHAPPASRPRQGWRSLCAAGCSSASAGRARLCARLRPSAAAGGRAEARRVPLGFGRVCGHFAFPGPGLDNPRGVWLAVPGLDNPRGLSRSRRAVCCWPLQLAVRVRACSPGSRDRRCIFHPRPLRDRRRGSDWTAAPAERGWP